jgi:Glucose-6-phosphate isomerase
MMRIDLANLHADRIGTPFGLELATDLPQEVARLEAARDAILARKEDPAAMLGWIDLPAQQTELLHDIETFATDAQERFDDLVVLGIGGSALGALAVHQALGRAAPARGDGLNLHVIDNVDSDVLHDVLGALDPRRTLVNVISKSGTTAETMAAFLVFERWLRDALGSDANQHIVATTDPVAGILRPYAERAGLTTFSVPANVGGRFSVFTPVGLLPLALAGHDVRALLGGAASILDDVRDAGASSVTLRLAAADVLTAARGATIHVMMPYASRLRRMADWYVQLWAESLGKRVDRDGNVVHAGTTPLPVS